MLNFRAPFFRSLSTIAARILSQIQFSRLHTLNKKWVAKSGSEPYEKNLRILKWPIPILELTVTKKPFSQFAEFLKSD